MADSCTFVIGLVLVLSVMVTGAYICSRGAKVTESRGYMVTEVLMFCSRDQGKNEIPR